MSLLKKKIKVGIDATCFNHRSSGAKQRFEGLYSQLFKIMPNTDFIIFEPVNYNLKSYLNLKNCKNVLFVKTNINSTNSIGNIVKSYFYWKKNIQLFNLDIFETFRLPIFKNSSVKIILTLHDLRHLYWSFAKYKKFFNNLYCKIFLKNIDQFIAVSKATKSEIISLLQYKNITVIENGIDQNTYKKIGKYNQNYIKKKYKISKEFILSVGHFELRKNYLNLILSFKKLENKNLQLVIIGNANSGKEKNYKKKIIETINYYKLNDQVKLISNLNDKEVKIFYKMSKLFVFPSIYEGFGIPLLEAMVFNKKILASNITPFKEILKFNQNTFFDPHNTNDLYKKIKKNIDNFFVPKNNYKSMLKKYQFHLLALKNKNLYLRMIKK